jgi:hypothetical protein
MAIRHPAAALFARTDKLFTRACAERPLGYRKRRSPPRFFEGLPTPLDFCKESGK